MTQRDHTIRRFLDESGWQDGERQFLAGDASFRHYERIVRPRGTAVLMDAPPEKEPVIPFVRMAEFLVEGGFSAPQIFARDIAEGLLLLEDLGDQSFTRLLKENPGQEQTLYLEASNVLIELHQQEKREGFLPDYSREKLLEEASLLVDWYLAAVLGKEAAASLREDYLGLWNNLLDNMPWLPDVVVLRDFHADNLMWVEGREGHHRVGLLDFQDAVMGSPAYDMVSFLEDARRDLRPETAQIVLNHYLQQMSWDRDQFMACYAVLGAQRNAKIIGIFTRLSQRDSKHHYLDYLPRVWQHFHHDIQHPLVRPLKQWLDRVLPVEKRGIPQAPKLMAV